MLASEAEENFHMSLRDAFKNPPKDGGNNSTMKSGTSNMKPRAATEATPRYHGGGMSLQERTDQQQVAAGDAEAPMRTAMGNYERALAQGAAAQSTLRGSFEAGEKLARERGQNSAQVQQAELRNFRRANYVEEAMDPDGPDQYSSFYDAERLREGNANVAMPRAVEVTRAGKRNDGKPV